MNLVKDCLSRKRKAPTDNPLAESSRSGIEVRSNKLHRLHSWPSATGSAQLYGVSPISSASCDSVGTEVSYHDNTGNNRATAKTDEPPVCDKYIKGTRLVVDGWFQACRGCNTPTVHSSNIQGRDVPLCPRCRSTFISMSTGRAPPHCVSAPTEVEPLCLWLPNVFPTNTRVADDYRKKVCEGLLLKQDDAWKELISSS